MEVALIVIAIYVLQYVLRFFFKFRKKDLLLQ